MKKLWFFTIIYFIAHYFPPAREHSPIDQAANKICAFGCMDFLFAEATQKRPGTQHTTISSQPLSSNETVATFSVDASRAIQATLQFPIIPFAWNIHDRRNIIQNHSHAKNYTKTLLCG
jgi:hypothetical protein